MEGLTLFKYEGLGNDFLVLFDPKRTSAFDAPLARAVSDRHRGIGADGLLRISNPRHDGDLFMELRNADGSIAETSGNGMRCAVLAAKHHGVVDRDEMRVETIAGVSSARILSDGAHGRAQVRVDMGQATIERRSEFDLPHRRAYGVHIGNPHLVLVGEVFEDVGVLEVGPDLETAVPGGQNVEVATVTSRGNAIAIDTWERGAGHTLACGSGSCASAAAARFDGLVADIVRVHNPGGDVTVELSGPPSSPSAILTGEARRIATISLTADDVISLLDATGTAS